MPKLEQTFRDYTVPGSGGWYPRRENRMMGNSLQDIITFGHHAGKNAAEYMNKGVDLKKPTFGHVIRFESELKESGVENPVTAPILLPDYSTEEVISKRWMEGLMENE